MSEYVYKKLGTLSEPECKVNVFGIITCIVKLHKPTLSGKLHSQIHIVDDTCREDFILHIFCVKEDDLPKELQVYKIIRVHRMKVEMYNDKLDGRVFKGQDIVVFEPDENSCAFYSIAKKVNMTDNDKRRLNQLRKWMKESYRFRCAFQVRDSELCNVKGEKVFNLFCKLTNVRMFADYETLVLTVVDATRCPELLYKVPDNWLGSELAEDFHRDTLEVDVIFYEGRDYYETVKIGDYCNLWNVKSVKCNVNITNEAAGYKLIMLKDESSIFTVPYGAGKTIVMQRTLERGPNKDVSSDSEIELSLQNKMKSFSVLSSEESGNEAEQEDNLRNSKFAYQTNDNDELLAVYLKSSASRTQTPKSEVKLPIKNQDVSASRSSVKSGSIDHEQLFKHASTSEQNNICEECDLSGSDTDIELEGVLSSAKANTISSHKEFPHCLLSNTEDFKYIQKGLHSSVNNLKVIRTSSSLCSKTEGTKRKLSNETNSMSNGDTSLNKKNSQRVLNKMEIDNKDDKSVASSTSSKSEFVIDTKTLEMWRNTFPTLFNVEQIELATEEVTDADNNCKVDILQHFDVFLIEEKPSLKDDAMDLVSGYCHSGCYEMYLHSTLIRDERNKTYLCPACNKQGLKREVQLMLLVELVVMNTSGAYLNVLVCSKQAEKFFGCTVEQYMCDIELRSSIVRSLLLHSVYKNIEMGCKSVPVLNLIVIFQENKYFVVNTKLKIK